MQSCKKDEPTGKGSLLSATFPPGHSRACWPRRRRTGGKVGGATLVLACWRAGWEEKGSCSWHPMRATLASPLIALQGQSLPHFTNMNMRVREALQCAHGHPADARAETGSQIPLSWSRCPVPLTLPSHSPFPPSSSKTVPKPLGPIKTFHRLKRLGIPWWYNG